MTKNEIIEKWFREGAVQKVVKKVSHYNKDSKFDDLVQIIYMYLLEEPEEKIQELEAKGQYMFFIARMVMVQATSARSRFYYQQRLFSHRTTEEDTNIAVAEPEELSRDMEKVEKALEYLTPKERAVFEQYRYFGSMKEMAKVEGVKYRTMNARVRKVLDKVKDYYERI